MAQLALHLRSLIVFALFGITSIGSVWLVAGIAHAEGPAAEDDSELPKSGSLSTSITTRGRNSTAVSNPWGGVSLDGKEASPISGSVSKSGKGWVARIFNNSEDSYSADFKIVQKGKNDTVLKSDSFSTTLRPKQNIERTLSAFPGVISADLELTKWKNLTPKKQEEDLVEKDASGVPEAKAPSVVDKKS